MNDVVISFDLGTVSMGYAIVQAPLRVLKFGIIDLGTNDSAQAVKAIHTVLTTDTYQFKDALAHGAEIVMESQPAHGAPKVVSHAMQMFCLDRGLTHEFMAPNEKLKIFPEMYAKFENNTRADRKKLSMLYCENFLAPQPALLAFYKSNPYKQRTDIADAVAQAVRRLQRRKIASTIEALLTFKMEDDLNALLAEFSSADAHPDELATGFKKRKYGETDKPSRAKKVCLDFNE
jgi:RNase H-fold protein (predicted Holliday junction resolvase)